MCVVSGKDGLDWPVSGQYRAGRPACQLLWWNILRAGWESLNEASSVEYTDT